MFDFLGDAIGAIASGGITGLLGAGINIFGEIKKQKLVFSHEEQMESLRQDSMRLQQDLNKAEAEAAMNVSEMKAFTESQKNDKAAYTDPSKMGAVGRFFMGFVDFMRGMIRPSMTIYMTVLTTLMYMEVMDLIGGLDGVLTKEVALQLANQIILVILYITTTVVLWWFGTRQKIIHPPGFKQS